MKGKILFITKGEEENFGDGFDYAADLARLRTGGVLVLFSYSERNFFQRFGDDMGAAALTEAGEVEAAKDYMSEYNIQLRSECSRKIEILKETAGDHGDLITDFHIKSGNYTPAIRKILEDYPSIEIVIMSPALTAKERSISIKKLMKKIPRPVVTMSRPVRA